MRQFQIRERIGSDSLPVHFHTFIVEESMDWMTIDVSLTRKKWIGFFLWDAEGKLRIQNLTGKAPSRIVLHKDERCCTALTIPGELPAGEWKIEIIVAEQVQVRDDSSYDILFETGTAEEKAFTEHSQDIWARGIEGGISFERFHWETVYQNEARWYKGDFHTHTVLSDGNLTQTENIEQAKKQGLDFFVATDHHVISTNWPTSKDVLVIPGIEVTSTKGHFNALGPKEWIDWRFYNEDGGMESEEGMNQILRQTKEAGAIRSINHPLLAPWHWQFQETLLEEVDVMELINDPTFPDNRKATEETLVLWDTLWNDGYTIYGIGGSDSHLKPNESYTEGGPPSLIGDPATYVFAKELSANAILQSVLSGNVYVSRGPQLEIEVTVLGKQYLVGSDLSECANQQKTAEFLVRCDNVPANATLEWVENGLVVEETNIGEALTFKRSFPLEGDYGWLRCQIRNVEGEVTTISNPIYFGKRKRELKTWSQLLKRAGFPS